MTIFSAADRAFWDEQGYVVVPNAVPQENLDRVNMNPTARPDWDYQGFIHWDFDPTTWPIGLHAQGVLNLTDTDEAQGGFQCVPASHRQVPEIVARQTPGGDVRRPDITDLTVKPIAGKAGDLVIWHTGLLHGNGRNRTDRPRLAQYITMSLAQPQNEEVRQQRIEQWQQRRPPAFARAFPGDPRKLEELHGQSAELTGLGKKLLGLDLW